MTVKKINEQYQLIDKYVYDEVEYDINGSLNKNENDFNLWLNIGNMGNISYSVNNGRETFNVEMPKECNIPFKTFLDDIYEKIVALNELDI